MKHLLPIALATMAFSMAADSPFACNLRALEPAARKRHFDVLSPALVAAKKSLRELPNGYEIGLPDDPATVKLVSEWIWGEHLCCPFFDIDLHYEREGGGLSLRLTGREGVKAFIRSDFKRMFPE